jgi:hypothetical protein
MFAFQREDPQSSGKQQLTWTHRVSRTLQPSLELLWHQICKCTQQRKLDAHSYLLLTAANHQDCLKGTEPLLHLLWEAGYKISQKKAQICQDKVKYLGFHISQGQQNLGTERKQAVCSILTPTSRRQIHEFLRVAGFYQMWIPNFSLLARLCMKPQSGEVKGSP